MLHLRGTLLRGGTSKCWIFDADQIESMPVDVDSVLLAAFGAADPRQLDGVGGATSTTSKALLIRRSSRPDSDVDYAFAQVGIGADRVEWGSNCGNCATAAGLHAVQAGLVPVRAGRTTVRLFNTNTETRVSTTVDTPGGRVPEDGTGSVPGVRATGVPVDLTFLAPAGGSTGALLPSGRPVDRIERPGQAVRATLVDAGAPAALVAASDLGLTAAEPVERIAEHVSELTALRRAAALRMRLATAADPVSHAVPKVGVVGPPVDYHTTDGERVAGADYDIAVRMVSMHAPHPAIGLTSAVAVAAASTVRGSVPADLLPRRAESGRLRIGTAAGVVVVRMSVDEAGVPVAVTLSRAARRIAEAEVFVPLPVPAERLGVGTPA